jgi:hypothetical protein
MAPNAQRGVGGFELFYFYFFNTPYLTDFGQEIHMSKLD